MLGDEQLMQGRWEGSRLSEQVPPCGCRGASREAVEQLQVGMLQSSAG